MLFYPYLPFIGRFKHNGGNFHIKLPLKGKLIPNVSVPEDLVQIQAYLRWERNGKQTYTPEQEKASKSCIRDSNVPYWRKPQIGVEMCFVGFEYVQNSSIVAV